MLRSGEYAPHKASQRRGQTVVETPESRPSGEGREGLQIGARHPGLAVEPEKLGEERLAARGIQMRRNLVQQQQRRETVEPLLDQLGVGEDEVGAWVDAFEYIQWLRLRCQCPALARNQCAGDNLIRPEALNEVDRRMLKECLRQARSLQSRLALDYQR